MLTHHTYQKWIWFLKKFPPDFRLYTTILQSSKQYGTGTKTEICTNGTRQRAHRETYTLTGTLSLTKEARIYNGEKTAFSISDAGKTVHLHAKVWN